MSTQSVQAFLAETKTNTALAAQVRGLKGDRGSALDQVVKIAGGAGFEFSSESYEAVVREHFAAKHAAKQLSPDEIAGLWGNQRDEKELSYDGTCSWFECQGTGDHCGSEKTVNTDPQTGCW